MLRNLRTSIALSRPTSLFRSTFVCFRQSRDQIWNLIFFVCKSACYGKFRAWIHMWTVLDKAVYFCVRDLFAVCYCRGISTKGCLFTTATLVKLHCAVSSKSECRFSGHEFEPQLKDGGGGMAMPIYGKTLRKSSSQDRKADDLETSYIALGASGPVKFIKIGSLRHLYGKKKAKQWIFLKLWIK